MIIDLVIGILVALFTGFLGLIPAFTLPSMGDFGASVGSALATANGIFPVVTIGACLVALVAVRVFLMTFTFIVWLYMKIPFKAT